MAILTAPALPVADFRMAWSDGDGALVENPYTGDLLDIARGVGRWQGIVSWDTGADSTAAGSLIDAQRANERTIQAFAASLQGRRNKLAVTLPGAPLYPYQPSLPAGATGQATAADQTDDGLEITITLTGAGGAFLEPGNCFTLQGRTYMVQARTGSVYSVLPEIVPAGLPAAATVEGVAMTLRIDGRALLGPRDPGNVQPVHLFAWSAA